METTTHWALFIGRLHPLLVHLPIGFLSMLAGLELLNRFHRFKGVGHARGVILAATVAACVASVVCGLLLSSDGGYDPQLLALHKWMGLSLCGSAVVTAVCYWRKKLRLYTGVLLATLLLLGPASHFGGSMTHGKDYLTAYAPVWFSPRRLPPTLPVLTATTDPMKVDLYGDVVHPVLLKNCVACHSDQKSSGGLILDTLDGVKKGGNTGPLYLPKNPDGSLMLQRISLPESDPKHMPPDGKPQLNEQQVAALRWWISTGPADDARVKSLNPTSDQTDLIVSLLGLSKPVDGAAPIPVATAAPMAAKLAGDLRISVTTIVPDQPWLAVNASLNKNFTDADLARLAPVAVNISTLNLAGTKVSDAGLAALELMPNLQRVRLERTAITDAGLAHFKQQRHLSYLNLYATKITDAGLKLLEGLPALRELYVWKTAVDPAAAAEFEAAKTDQSKITRLEKQIAELQKQIADQHVSVVQGVGTPATQPAAAAK